MSFVLCTPFYYLLNHIIYYVINIIKVIMALRYLLRILCILSQYTNITYYHNIPAARARSSSVETLRLQAGRPWTTMDTKQGRGTRDVQSVYRFVVYIRENNLRRFEWPKMSTPRRGWPYLSTRKYVLLLL